MEYMDIDTTFITPINSKCEFIIDNNSTMSTRGYYYTRVPTPSQTLRASVQTVSTISSIGMSIDPVYLGAAIANAGYSAKDSAQMLKLLSNDNYLKNFGVTFVKGNTVLQEMNFASVISSFAQFTVPVTNVNFADPSIDVILTTGKLPQNVIFAPGLAGSRIPPNFVYDWGNGVLASVVSVDYTREYVTTDPPLTLSPSGEYTFLYDKPTIVAGAKVLTPSSISTPVPNASIAVGSTIHVGNEISHVTGTTGTIVTIDPPLTSSGSSAVPVILVTPARVPVRNSFYHEDEAGVYEIELLHASIPNIKQTDTATGSGGTMNHLSHVYIEIGNIQTGIRTSRTFVSNNPSLHPRNSVVVFKARARETRSPRVQDYLSILSPMIQSVVLDFSLPVRIAMRLPSGELSTITELHALFGLKRRDRAVAR